MMNSRIILFCSLSVILQLTFVDCNKGADCRTIRCSNFWEPVCAYDGFCYKTITNACQVMVENCSRKKNDAYNVVHEGECDATEVPTCPQ